jgi:hypothetical protein
MFGKGSRYRDRTKERERERERERENHKIAIYDPRERKKKVFCQISISKSSFACLLNNDSAVFFLIFVSGD